TGAPLDLQGHGGHGRAPGNLEQGYRRGADPRTAPSPLLELPRSSRSAGRGGDHPPDRRGGPPPMRIHRSRPRGRSPRIALLASLLLPPALPGLRAADSAVGEEAVRKHVDYLKSILLGNQAGDGSWQESGYPVGMTALAVLALKHAGLAEDHPSLQRGVAFLEQTFEGKVYSESLVICALELMAAERYRERMERAVSFLARAQNSQGAWSYGAGQGRTY